MYAGFAKVAEGNQYAWSYGAPTETAESIGTPSKKNRMICHPCMFYASRSHFTSLTIMPDTLLMNAFNNINLAAACILTSVDFARELGVPEEKWIYPLGGAGTKDSDECETNGALMIIQADKRQSGNVQTSPPAHRSRALSTQLFKLPIQKRRRLTCSTSTRLSYLSLESQKLD